MTEEYPGRPLPDSRAPGHRADDELRVSRNVPGSRRSEGAARGHLRPRRERAPLRQTPAGDGPARGHPRRFPDLVPELRPAGRRRAGGPGRDRTGRGPGSPADLPPGREEGPPGEAGPPRGLQPVPPGAPVPRPLQRGRIPPRHRRVREGDRPVPRFAPAWATLASAFAGLADYAASPAEIAANQAKAIAAVARAVELDPGLAEAYAIRGQLLAQTTWDWKAAGEDFDRALALAPGDADIAEEGGLVARPQGRLSEAIQQLGRSTQSIPSRSPAGRASASSRRRSARAWTGRRPCCGRSRSTRRTTTSARRSAFASYS